MSSLMANEKSFQKNVWRVFKKQRCIYNPCEHLRWSFSVNILNGFIFSQYKLHHRSSTGLYIGLWKYWDFQSEAKAEQIIAIVTAHSVSCFVFISPLSHFDRYETHSTMSFGSISLQTVFNFNTIFDTESSH